MVRHRQLMLWILFVKDPSRRTINGASIENLPEDPESTALAAGLSNPFFRLAFEPRRLSVGIVWK